MALICNDFLSGTVIAKAEFNAWPGQKLRPIATAAGSEKILDDNMRGWWKKQQTKHLGLLTHFQVRALAVRLSKPLGFRVNR